MSKGTEERSQQRANDFTRNERALLQGLLAGDPRTQDELVSRYTPLLARALSSYLRDPEDVADICQETLLEVVRRIDRFEGRSTLWCWIRGIGVKQALLRLRQRRRRPEISLDEVNESVPPAAIQTRLLDYTTCSDDRAERNELGEQVQHAIADLPYQYRDIVVLRDLRGHSTQEAADILGIRPTTARVRLHRARRALRSSLDGVIDPQDLHA